MTRKRKWQVETDDTGGIHTLAKRFPRLCDAIARWYTRGAAERGFPYRYARIDGACKVYAYRYCKREVARGVFASYTSYKRFAEMHRADILQAMAERKRD